MTTLQQQARALGDPTRHQVFRYLADAVGPVDVSELTEHFGLNHNAIRQHLAKLVEAGLVVEETAPSRGRGRPRLVYLLDPATESRWGVTGPYERLSLWLAEMVRTKWWMGAATQDHRPRRRGRDLRPPPGPQAARLDLRAMTVVSPVTHPDPASHDLETRADIHDLVVAFYREIVFDDLLEPVFGEVAEVDWALHIPKLIDYWCRVLLGQPGYMGTILNAHRHVHDIEPFRAEHFDRWYALWIDAIEQRWAGPTADLAKTHAAHIAAVLARKLLDLDWQPPTPTPVRGTSPAPVE